MRVHGIGVFAQPGPDIGDVGDDIGGCGALPEPLADGFEERSIEQRYVGTPSAGQSSCPKSLLCPSGWLGELGVQDSDLLVGDSHDRLFAFPVVQPVSAPASEVRLHGPDPHSYRVGSPPRTAMNPESSPRWKKMRPRSDPSSSSTAQRQSSSPWTAIKPKLPNPSSPNSMNAGATRFRVGIPQFRLHDPPPA